MCWWCCAIRFVQQVDDRLLPMHADQHVSILDDRFQVHPYLKKFV